MKILSKLLNSIHETEYEVLTQMARKAVEKLPQDDVEFRLMARVSEGYDALFRKKGRISKEQELLPLAERVGRVIVCGKGGSGKTHLLRRLARTALEQGFLPVLISLRDWGGADDRDWRDWSAEPGGGAAFLLDRFTEHHLSPTELDLVPPSVRKVFLVDGLNEMSGPLAHEILREIDELVRDQMRTCAIISDRLARRELPSPDRWALAHVLPLDAEQVRTSLKNAVSARADDPLLRSPFFLDAAIKGSGAPNIPNFVAGKASLSRDQLLQVASMAFDVYEQSAGRTFSLDFLSGIESSIRERLIHSGLLRVSGDRAYFTHHLVHDYLAAIHLASLGSEHWTASALDALSFGSSAFDAVAFVLIELDRETSDVFLRRLYDWNLYAAGYAINEADHYPGKLSNEIQIVILAMLAEKRFDPVLATQTRANDALLVSELDLAKQFIAAASLDDLVALVADTHSKESWFCQWKTVFTIRRAHQVSPQDFELLFANDSIAGWTLANVLKRMPSAEWQQERLITRLKDASAPVRWRIAHVLGAFPSLLNIDILTTLLDTDSDPNVRYGAVRSLVETGWRGEPNVRQHVGDVLQSRLAELRKTPKLLDELVRAVLIDRLSAPEDWMAFVIRQAKSLFVSEEKMERRDRWRRLASDAERLYQPTNRQ